MIKVLMIAAFLLLLFFLFAYGMYRAVFCYPPGRRPDVHCIPNSGLYRVHRDKMLECIADMEMTPFEEVSILSADGLRLYGRFYRFKADALLILFFFMDFMESMRGTDMVFSGFARKTGSIFLW